ncbi:MAG TPA: HlyD family efflux transporter periplasmic adaptor subunit [Steroidobacteraceae bacterium]|nr:HlyD family efflux transporter periplasmic adaptor subunit [Steroidobacteraceae bacterium]
MTKKRLLLILVLLAAVGGGIAWWFLSKPKLPPGFAGSNGRLEATQVDIAAKYPGRLKTVTANEGDTIEPGQVVATIDTEPLEAQLRAAQAKIREAQDNLRTAQAQVRVKQSELDFAQKQYKRSKQLVVTGAVSGREADADLARADSARAALIGTQAQVVAAQSLIDAQTAEAERLKATIADNTLKSPIRARVQGRLAEPGEVVAEGGKVLSTLDLSDVYMYVFLPTNVAGKLALGAEARIVLDALPDYPIKAVVSYIDPNAQFTPKQVETAEERHNLTFRVKLQIPDKEKLRAYERMVKVGIPGMGYVRLDPSAPWPKNLQLRPPSEWPKLPEVATGTTTNGAVPEKQ